MDGTEATKGCPSARRRPMSPKIVQKKKKSNNPCLVVLSNADREREYQQRRLKSYQYNNDDKTFGGSSPTNNNNRLSCAIHALKCSSRADDDADEDHGALSGYQHYLEEKYRQSLFERNADDAVQWRREEPLKGKPTSPRLQQQQQRSYLSTLELDQEISKFIVNGGHAFAAATPSSVSSFADFDCEAALEAVSRRANAKEEDDTPAVIVSSDPPDLKEVGSNGRALEIFADDDDDDTQDGEDDAPVTGTTSLGNTDNNQSHNINQHQKSSAAAAVVVQNFPLTPVQQDRLCHTVTEDSNDTPTTCNRSLVSPTATPLEAVQRQYRQHFSSSRDENNDEKEDGKPPRRIMQKSLALGDAISPEDANSSPMEEGEPSAIKLLSTTSETYRRNEMLQLPDIAARSKGSLLHEEKKVEDEDKNGASKQASRRSLRNKVSSFSYESSRNDDDGSFSSLSSFSVSSSHATASQQMQKVRVGRKSSLVTQNKLHKPTTRPFFWKTHPPVTFKSYHFQQPKPKMKRVVPNIETVGSMDSFSTFGGNPNMVSPTRPMMQQLPEQGKTEAGNDVQSSTNPDPQPPYMHPADVRKMWADSQHPKMEETSASPQQQRMDPSASHPLEGSAALNIMYSMASVAHRNIHAALSRTYSESSSVASDSSSAMMYDKGALV